MENHKQREQHQVYLDTAESQMMKTEGQRQDYIAQINERDATISRLMDMIKSLQSTLDSVTSSNQSLMGLVEELKAEIRDLKDRNVRHNRY